MVCQGFQFTGTTLTAATPTPERTISRWEIGASLLDVYLRFFQQPPYDECLPLIHLSCHITNINDVHNFLRLSTRPLR